MNNAAARDEQNFSAWLEEFKSTAFEHFESEPLVNECLESIRFNPAAIEKYKNQAEFTRSINEYLGIAASEVRAETGRGKLAGYCEALSKIEILYGVEPAILIAIWGIETGLREADGRLPRDGFACDIGRLRREKGIL